MSLTITIPGAVNVTTGAMAPAVLTVGVGVPGAAGPQGPAGPGVPVGGTAGQYLQKIDGTNYNTDWVTLNLAAYAPLASPAFTGNPTAPTAALGDNDTSLATTAFVQQELLSGTANARNLEVYVRNQTGSTIPAGSIVYINGATGNRPTITLAQANNDANSAQTFGFVKTSIANNGFGFVIVRGELENIDTSALTEGVQLYLSPTTAGTWTTTKPSAPQHLVYVGICVRAHPTQGVILVAVQNGYELNELHDVKITSPTNGQVLKYDSTQSLWVNGTDSAGVAWGAITGTLTSQTDLSTALNGKLDLVGGALTVNSTIDASTATTASVFSGTGLNAELSANPSENASLQYSGLQVQNAVGTMSVTPAGLTFPNASSQTVAYPGSAGFLLKADNLSGLADTAVSRTNLGLGTMATATAADYSTTTVANGLYYPLSGNPSGFLTSSALTGYATETFVTSQGYITSSALTPYAPLAGSTFTGKVNTVASAAGGAGLNLPHGAAPTTPVNGDLWTTTSGLFARINGGTQQYAPLGSNNTFSNASSTYGSSTAAGTLNFGTGATISGATKAINIGTNGVSGSTTNITLGSTTGTSTTTLQGITNGVTAAADTNSVALATTAYVVGQASAVAPSNDAATAAVGTSLRYARADHVHLNPLPAGGSANQVLAKVDATSYNTQWVTPSGGGSATDYQTYTTPGTFTWTKPAGAKWVDLVMFAGGGGGGSGGRCPTGTGSGGGGGGASSYVVARFLASSLGATQSVVVGAGGAGGASVATDATIGVGGSAGGNSSFYNLTAIGGFAGNGGNINSTPAAGGAAPRSGYTYASAPQAATGAGGSGAVGTGGTGLAATVAASTFYPTGGGGGAGNNATNAGGIGGSKIINGATGSGLTTAISGGAGGTTGGVPAVVGTSGATIGCQGGLGGGGGASSVSAAAMAGATGGLCGGGGGGGGCSVNGFASGAGGAGGGGAVFIITYC